MITITVLELFKTIEPMGELLRQPHKGRSAFVIRRLWRTMLPEVQAACAARDTLFNETNSVENGAGRAVKPELLEQFLREPLFSTEVSFECEPLTAEILADATISPAQLDLLGPLIAD